LLEPGRKLKMTGPGTQSRRPQPMTLLLLIEELSSLCGFIGGIPLIADPSGGLLGLPLGGTKALSTLPMPIHDFFLPGLWLFFVYGIGFANVAYYLWSGNAQAWSIALILCIVWLGWISFEVIFFGPSPLTTVWYVPQVASLILLLSPNVRAFVSAFR
jgi:hypothetical protein